MKTFSEFLKEDSEENLEIIYPEGVYISVKPTEETLKSIVEYQEKYLKGYNLAKEVHCTLIYSQKPQVDEIETKEYTALGTFKEFNLFGPDKDTLVIEINSQDLTRRNQELVEKYGFISDYDEYKSHITIATEVKDITLNCLPSIDFVFNFENETAEPLNTEWSGNKEKEDKQTLAGKSLDKMKKELEKAKKEEDSDTDTNTDDEDN